MVMYFGLCAIKQYILFPILLWTGIPWRCSVFSMPWLFYFVKSSCKWTWCGPRADFLVCNNCRRCCSVSFVPWIKIMELVLFIRMDFIFLRMCSTFMKENIISAESKACPFSFKPELWSFRLHIHVEIHMWCCLLITVQQTTISNQGDKDSSPATIHDSFYMASWNVVYVVMWFRVRIAYLVKEWNAYE